MLVMVVFSTLDHPGNQASVGHKVSWALQEFKEPEAILAPGAHRVQQGPQVHMGHRVLQAPRERKGSRLSVHNQECQGRRVILAPGDSLV